MNYRVSAAFNSVSPGTRPGIKLERHSRTMARKSVGKHHATRHMAAAGCWF
jgi:hypothetical protein